MGSTHPIPVLVSPVLMRPILVGGAASLHGQAVLLGIQRLLVVLGGRPPDGAAGRAHSLGLHQERGMLMLFY